MKRFILILLVIFSVTSCYKTYIIDEPWPVGKSFQDTFIIGDTTTYYMSCNVTRVEVEMYFARKTRRITGVKEYIFGENIYYINQYTVFVTREDYRYTPDKFKEVLIEKNKIPRDTTIFKFTPEMYCSWSVFDQMYKTYVK